MHILAYLDHWFWNKLNIDHLAEDIDIHIPLVANEKGQYYPIYLSPFEIFGQSKEDFYQNPLNEKFINTAIQRIEEASGKSLQDVMQSGEKIGYINDTPGLEPASTVVSYDSRYRYFTVIRQQISSLYRKYHWAVASYLAAYTLLNLLILGMLFRIFQSDENYKGK